MERRAEPGRSRRIDRQAVTPPAALPLSGERLCDGPCSAGPSPVSPTCHMVARQVLDSRVQLPTEFSWRREAFFLRGAQCIREVVGVIACTVGALGPEGLAKRPDLRGPPESGVLTGLCGIPVGFSYLPRRAVWMHGHWVCGMCVRVPLSSSACGKGHWACASLPEAAPCISCCGPDTARLCSKGSCGARSSGLHGGHYPFEWDLPCPSVASCCSWPAFLRARISGAPENRIGGSGTIAQTHVGCSAIHGHFGQCGGVAGVLERLRIVSVAQLLCHSWTLLVSAAVLQEFWRA